MRVNIDPRHVLTYALGGNARWIVRFPRCQGFPKINSNREPALGDTEVVACGCVESTETEIAVGRQCTGVMLNLKECFNSVGIDRHEPSLLP
jgi:hypothetical protein